jgi:Ran GTPase-activating protein (RanGAP) involved in mRNA processing and transport
MPKSPKHEYSSPKLKVIPPEDALDTSLKMIAASLSHIATSYDKWVDLQREIFESEVEEIEVGEATVGTAEYKSSNGDDEEEEEEPEPEEPAARFVPHQKTVP